MDNSLHDIVVEYSQGGMREFSMTGVYPEYISFYSEKLNKLWRQKVKNGARNGQVRMAGKVFFHYIFDIKKEQCELIDNNGKHFLVDYMQVESD